jgi:hypothetical protein
MQSSTNVANHDIAAPGGDLSLQLSRVLAHDWYRRATGCITWLIAPASPAPSANQTCAI